MGAHGLVDILGYVLEGAFAILAVFLAARLNRHDSERKGFQDTLNELKQDVAEIKGFLKGTFKF